MIRRLVILAISITLGACVSVPEQSADAYNPEKHARIRLYAQPTKPAKIYYYDFENRKGFALTMGGGVTEMAASLLGTIKNESVGMPQTEVSKSFDSENGILPNNVYKSFYKEFIVPAATTLWINYRFEEEEYYSDPNRRMPDRLYWCSTGLTVDAKAGKDYEIVPIQTEHSCKLTAFEIAPNGDVKEVKKRYEY